MRKSITLVLWLAASLQAGAQTQTVWRCGPDGSSYSSQPCPGGRVVEVADARPAADVQAAREVAERERRLASELRQERLDRERLVSSTGPVRVSRAKPAAEVKPPTTRQAKTSLPTRAKGLPTRKARSPEAADTSVKVALASRQRPD